MTEIRYTSTRDASVDVPASYAILQGISKEGGLFVPKTMPELDLDWSVLKDASYQSIASLVLGAFLTDFSQEEIEACVNAAYDEKFSDPAIAPLKRLDQDLYVLELFHGPTIAFKDMALTILPHLLLKAAQKQGCQDEIVILTATSGDTGKAALAGFADVDQTKILVFYPKGGVSEIQEKQMVTQAGNNVKVFAIKGNFDDAQTAVKEIFNDQALQATLADQGKRFSSANSINIGRLMPQVAYYVWTYAQMVKNGLEPGQEIDVVVPTGNFGNILAAHYARAIGTPIGKLVCAANENNVLVDFFNQGLYDKNRPFYLTSSPSMDILVSSNLERLVYELVDTDSQYLGQLMTDLNQQGIYQLTAEHLKKAEGFYADFATQDQVSSAIASVFENHHYLMDPHTAVAYVVGQGYRQVTEEAQAPLVIVSTASPYKFPRSVMSAFGSVKDQDDFDLLAAIHQKSGLSLPEAVSSLQKAPVLHEETIQIDQMVGKILDFIQVNHEEETND
ncbi:TPA: threonine synthase [Streptococcus suis]